MWGCATLLNPIAGIERHCKYKKYCYHSRRWACTTVSIVHIRIQCLQFQLMLEFWPTDCGSWICFVSSQWLRLFPESVNRNVVKIPAYFPHSDGYSDPIVSLFTLVIWYWNSGCRLVQVDILGWPASSWGHTQPPLFQHFYIRHARICRHRPSDCIDWCTTTPVGLRPRCGCKRHTSNVVIGKGSRVQTRSQKKAESAIVWSWIQLNLGLRYLARRNLRMLEFLFMSLLPQESKYDQIGHY